MIFLCPMTCVEQRVSESIQRCDGSRVIELVICGEESDHGTQDKNTGA
jgi:hypothetical protein